MARPHTSELIEATATCQRCNWSTNGNNAQGLAAQHYDQKGHRVVVETRQRLTYGAIAGKTAKTDGQGTML